jgi:hypothetical protein
MKSTLGGSGNASVFLWKKNDYMLVAVEMVFVAMESGSELC